MWAMLPHSRWITGLFSHGTLQEGQRAHAGHGEYLREEACERQPAQRSRHIQEQIGQQHASPQHLLELETSVCAVIGIHTGEVDICLAYRHEVCRGCSAVHIEPRRKPWAHGRGEGRQMACKRLPCSIFCWKHPNCVIKSGWKAERSAFEHERQQHPNKKN